MRAEYCEERVCLSVCSHISETTWPNFTKFAVPFASSRGLEFIMKQGASLTERDNRLAHYFALFRGLELLLGYLATSGAKSDDIFLLGDPDFL